MTTNQAMRKLPKGYIDLEKLCSIEGLLHSYFVDTENVVLASNQLQKDFAREIFNVENVIGKKLSDFIECNHLAEARVIHDENAEVISSGVPKQFYNIWIIPGHYNLELLTIKIPVYQSNGKILGVFGMSHYINKFSISKAAELGLTKRETQCLFLLLKGQGVKQIAKELCLSVRTVETYLDNMKIKLKVSSKTELIIKALSCKVKQGIAEKIVLDNTMDFISIPLSNY